jgi:hypothetical protein
MTDKEIQLAVLHALEEEPLGKSTEAAWPNGMKPRPPLGVCREQRRSRI